MKIKFLESLLFNIKYESTMKKITTIIALLLVTTNILFSQTAEFTKLLNEDMNKAVNMIKNSDGNFIIAGNNEHESNVFIACVSPQGEMLWSNYFLGKMHWTSKITQKSNGNILLPMGDFVSLLIELNSQGVALDTIISCPDTTNSYFNRAIEISDTTIIVSQIIYNDVYPFSSIDRSELLKISKDGEIIDNYPFNSSQINDLFLNSEKNLFLLQNSLHTTKNTYITELTTDGGVLSTTQCDINDQFLNKIFELDESNYFALGFTDSASLVCFNTNNFIQSCNEYEYGWFTSVTKSLTNENIYALANTHISNKSFSCNIVNIDSDGNVLRDFIISDSLTGDEIISDNEYLYIAGTTNYSTEPRACFVKIHQDSIMSVPNSEQIKFNIFPNPTSDYVFIQNPSNEKISSIELFDISGKSIKVFTGNQNRLDIKGIKSGIYFYTIHTSEFVTSGKIMVAN